jgi:YHS domain-containing protein
MTIPKVEEHCCSGPVDDRALTDPVCGMKVTSRSPYSHELLSKTYYFCSAACLEKFQSPVTASESRAGGRGHEEPAALVDPVCGMDVAADTTRKHVHAGKTYLFCSDTCVAELLRGRIAS